MAQMTKAPAKRAPKAQGQAAGSKPAGSGSNPTVCQDEVARVAYALYEKRGRISGHDQEDWLEAERIVRTRAAQSRP